MESLPTILFQVGEIVDDMADNYITTDRYIGDASIVIGKVDVGVQDGDTVRKFFSGATITEGNALSVHGEDDADYKNTSGFDAIAVIVLIALSGGAATRHVKIYSAPTTDSTAGATLVWETGQTDSPYFDASLDRLTSAPVKIQDDHFIVIENVDDARAGANDVKNFGVEPSTSGGFVVERQS